MTPRIDLANLTYINLPPELRQPIRYDWLIATNRGIFMSYNDAEGMHIDDKFFLNHTAQVLSLEHLVNTKLTLNLPFYITDGILIPTIYSFNIIENKDRIYQYNKSESINSIYGYNKEEYDTTLFDFVLNISLLDFLQVDYIKDLVDTYKVSGKKYRIDYY